MAAHRAELVLELLRKLRWANRDIRAITGWNRHQVYRWRLSIGLGVGRYMRRSAVRRRDPEFWEELEFMAGVR